MWWSDSSARSRPCWVRAAQPVITAYPTGTAHETLPTGVVIDKHHVRMVITP